MLRELGHRLRSPEVLASIAVAVAVLVAGFVLTAVPGIGAEEFGVDRLLMAAVSTTGRFLASGVARALEPGGGVLIVAAVGAVVWWRLDLRRSAWFVLTAVVPWLSVEPVKLLVHRPRPVLPGVQATAESWSYPSGHVALATAIVLGLVAVTSGRVRARVLVVGTVAVAVVAVSRLVLGAHYPSDVVAPVAWTTAVWVALRHVVAGPASGAGSRSGPGSGSGHAPTVTRSGGH